MRYNAVDFIGNVMVHCHILKHEDKGMMNMDLIVSQSGLSKCSSK